jgi:hypothetical protein
MKKQDSDRREFDEKWGGGDWPSVHSGRDRKAIIIEFLLLCLGEITER